MFHRVTATASSLALTLTVAAVTLTPTAHADPAPLTYTGYVQVVDADNNVVGCVSPGQDATTASNSTDASSAYRVSMSGGSRQNLTIQDPSGAALGVDSTISPGMTPHAADSSTVLAAGPPVPAGSPSVAQRQTAIWTIDAVTWELSADYVWEDQSTERLAPWRSINGFQGLTRDYAALAARFTEMRPTTFRLGENCSGPLADPQTITFTSAAPTTVYPGQTYTVAATGGASGNPVTFTSATSEICEIDGTTVTFIKPGTCTIEADQAGATGYSAAPTVSQDITVSHIPTAVRLDLDTDTIVTGQTITARAQLSAATGSVDRAGGLVVFLVDGTEVESTGWDDDGLAVTQPFTATFGTHQIEAYWNPENNALYADSTDNATLTVAAAGTTTKVSVKTGQLSATVAPVAPGAGSPTGEVTFFVDGAKVGAAGLTRGVATLAHTVPTDKTHAVSASYAGSTDFTASSHSTSRSNPTIKARVGSAKASRKGWYRTPVKVSFACSSAATLVTPCPKPVTITRQGASSVTRTIRTTDGGIATATAAVKLDRTAPRVGIKGVKAGRSYFDAPKPTCSAKDSLSGVKNCKVTTKRHGSKVTVIAKATDVAGNVRTKKVAYRLAAVTIQGAKKKNGVYQVRHGETYTIRVRGAKANYVYATPAPGKPHRGSVPFKKAGKNTWALSVTMSMTTSATRTWNLGYTQNGKLHVIKVKVKG